MNTKNGILTTHTPNMAILNQNSAGIIRPKLQIYQLFAFIRNFNIYTTAPYHPLKTDEICDGLDNDCDGETDEDLPFLVCGNDACPLTVPSCKAGVPQECPPLDIQPEVCDGIDNDCDGVIDNGVLCPG